MSGIQNENITHIAHQNRICQDAESINNSRKDTFMNGLPQESLLGLLMRNCLYDVVAL